MINLKTTLLQYQEEAVDKLYRLRIGALYMEMGTGKTRTALEIVHRRIKAGKLDGVIWLCPCSVKQNLRNDLSKHADGWEQFITICGIETLSTSVGENVRLREMAKNETVMLIVDESNLVKNPNALRSEHITTIAEMCRYRMILNGTPVSRNEADLFQQWFILDWRVLGYKSYYSFAANHLEYDDKFTGKIRRVLHVDYLTDKIAPYTFQIKKSDVLKLPEKKYNIRYINLSQKQEEIYDGLEEKYLEMVDEMRPETIYKLFGVLQQCISGTEIIEKEDETPRITHKPIFQDSKENPRIQELLNIVDHLGEEKAIIFAKYTDEIYAICSALGDRAVPFYGELSQKRRNISIQEFREGRQFLVANKACGAYGLNLQFCHIIIFYSNDWDYATRQQAEDRVHRIGQSETVQIYDIITANTLDVRIQKCLDRKDGMAESFKRRIKDKKGAKEWLHGRESLSDDNGVGRNTEKA